MKPTTTDEIVEMRLTNGLGVLLKEDHSAPIASIWMWYRVGSRNELPGKTGISHWVEHMQFKGTPNFAKGHIFREVSRVGGTLNALTSHDWTAYFETVPANHIELSLRIESDRMTNSLFDPKEVEPERTVILSERQGAENNPGYALYEEVAGTAFHAHPYRHMVIGYESDLRQITRDDLYGHYRRFYHPANAFLVAVGDFQAKDVIERVDRAFGGIPGGDPVPQSLAITEPPQPGERRVLLRRPSGVPYLRMAFHAPRAADSDLVPLMVAEAVLSGGQPMGFGGGGSMGRSSRLYRALVASGLARSAGSDMSVNIDPYLFQIGVTALPEPDLSKIERIVELELARLREEPVSAAELDRAMRQLEAQFVYSSEGVTNQGYWLGQWDIVDNWRRAGSLPDEIRGVSAKDVQRVAQQYLVPERRTVGWLEPTAKDGAAARSSAEETSSAFTAVATWGLDGPHFSGQRPGQGLRRAVLPNGIAALGQERGNSRSVALRMRIPAGSIRESLDESGIAHLTGRCLLRGSGGRSFDEINTRTDELGSSISVDTGREFLEVQVRGLRDDFPEVVDLLAQTLQRPDFPEVEIARVKAEQLGAIAETDNDTRATAERLMRRSVYPEPNPLGRRVLGTIEAVAGVHADAVRAFHSRAIGPTGTSIAVVGGFGGFERAVETLSEAFGSWERSSATVQAGDLTATNVTTVRLTEEIRGKSQADIAVGIATVPRGHADFYALDVGNLILGRLGLMGRLGGEVRDRQGLAYYAFSQLEPRNDGGLWGARAGVGPANIDRAIEAIDSELARLRSDLVSEDELEDAKSYLIGVLPLALETHDGVASTLLAIEEFGLGLDYLDRYPEIIARISRDDVRRAAREHLDPDRLAIGIAGPAAS